MLSQGKEQKGENEQKQGTVTKDSKRTDDMVFVIHEIALAGKNSLHDEYDI